LAWGLILIQVFTIVAIVMALRMLLHKQFTSAMSRLKNLDEDNLKKQQELDRRLKEAEGERRSRLGQAEAEAQRIMERARIEAKELVDKIKMESKDESKRVINDVLDQKEAILKEYKAEIEEKVISFSKELVKTILDDEILSVVKSDMIKRVMAALDKTDMTALSASSNKVEILSDKDLPEADRKRILDIMSKNGIAKKQVDFVKNSSVVGGLIIRCGEYVLDGSVSNRMQRAIPALKEKLNFGV